MKKFSSAPRPRGARLLAAPLALGCLLLLCAADARADAVQLFARAQLSASAVTAQYNDPAFSSLPSPYSFAAGGNTLTFDNNGGQFERRDDGDAYESDFAAGTRLLLSQTGGATSTTVISFANGVTEFGLDLDTPTGGLFNVEIYNGDTLIGSFSVADTTPLPGVAGATAFVGAMARSGDLITRVVITSPVGQGFTNNYALGPVSFAGAAAAEPVPEPATLVLLGTGLAGATAAARRRRRRAAG